MYLLACFLNVCPLRQMCCMLRECLEGRWAGQTWWVLRRQDTILAVGEGLPDEDSKVSIDTEAVTAFTFLILMGT